jgi:hypothetical protein
LYLLLGSLVASWGRAPVGQGRGPRAPGATTTLATPWPAQDGCMNYYGADLSVDDRVSAVEWRGASGASLAFDLAKPFPPKRDQDYRLGSEGYDCHVHGTSCLVYRKPIGRPLNVRAIYASRLLPTDFQAGAFSELVVHGDTRQRGRPARSDRVYDFGLRLILHCQDRSQPSVAWVCDARACVPRTFRDNVKMLAFRREEEKKPRREQRRWPADEIPNLQQWWKGAAPKDLTALICMRGQAGIAEVEQAARGRVLLCEEKGPFAVKKLPFATARPRLIDLGRDLLRDMDLVLDEGCAGACSARIDELRATTRALAAASDLHLIGVRAVFHDSHDEFGYGAYPSLGFTASLVARAGAVEIVCARHRTFTSMGLPDAEECRLTIAARGRRVADYVPNYEPFVELPDGGVVRLLDQAPSMNPDAEASDKIVVIGSALAQRPR